MGLTQRLGTIPLAIQTDSSNNVGIGGAANASYKLAVTGATLHTDTIRILTGANTSDISYAVGKEMSSNNAAFFGWRFNSGGTPYGFISVFGTSGRFSLMPDGGNVGIGTSSPARLLHLNSSGDTYIRVDSYNGTLQTLFGTDDLGTYIGQQSNNIVRFITNSAERMRITSGGAFKASTNGTYLSAGASYHELRQSNTDTNIAIFTNIAASPYGPFIWFPSASPNNTTNYFLACTDSVNDKAIIYSNGTYGSRTGTYGSIISDIKYKQDIIDANSQWDDIKNLRVVNFKYKEDVELDGENALRQIGFIAQEVEAVSPNLVYEAGKKDTEETWKSVKTSIIHLKAVKALQEAMARIEELEAKVTALENK